MKCNNKHCTNPVNDNKVCHYCCKVMYCSDNCVKIDWEIHKFSCARLFVLKDFIPIKNSKLLGKGAYGEVQLVQHVRSKNLFAIKIIKKSQVIQTPIEIFLREISIHKALIHPNISRLYDHLEDRNKFYLILEYVERGSLFNIIKNKGKFSEAQAADLFKQTCVGVNFLHENKIIHRDIKSENLLLSKDGTIKICDFGWCALGPQPRETFCGTEDYMAPEMINSENYNHKVDVWALGILLFELLHGRLPFPGLNLFEKIKEIDNLVLKEDLSDSVKDLIKFILNKDPNARPEVKDILKHCWFEQVSAKLRVGTLLKHSFYGEGLVTVVQGSVCTIRFNDQTLEIVDCEAARLSEIRIRTGAKSQDLLVKSSFNLNVQQRRSLTLARIGKNLKEIISNY